MEPRTDTRPLLSSDSQRHALVRGGALRVLVCGGTGAGRTFLGGQRVVIGRSQRAELVLADVTTSEFHVELSLSAEGILLTDLQSTNGTWLGPVRIRQGCVPPGTLLQVGQSTLRVDVVPADLPPVEPDPAMPRLLGLSPPMVELRRLVARLARNDLSVLLQGETGTGKEAAARSLHECSSRAHGPFVVLDCAALPETLAPSILFGHERGAFTGASERRIGVFEAAHGGVLFIDELGELPPSLQPLLLRVLEGREVTPVGGSRSRRVDVRIIAATWRDLRAMVNQGRFRDDLYYRIAQATGHIPALAERAEDIPLLVSHFLQRIPAQTPAVRAIDDSALASLQRRSFPGNLRELRNLVERAALLSDGPTISDIDMGMERTVAIWQQRAPISIAQEPDAVDTDALTTYHEAKRTAQDSFESSYLIRLLRRTDGNLSRAAALAGVERQNLRALLRKHGLYRPRRSE